MATPSPSSPRDRILQAALSLLEAEGREAVSTRAVSAAAGVQPPTIYRQFGDMQGLLDAVASAGFTSYLTIKREQRRLSDPVQELRLGWNRHVAFGLAHPHLYTLMYSLPRQGGRERTQLEGAAILKGLMQRVAEAGRLAVSVDRAAALSHAGAVGVTLCSLEDPGQGQELSELMREAVLSAILVAEPGAAAPSVRQQAAAHAVSLVALLPELDVPFSPSEMGLLLEWLRRLM